ncbi:GGDEF domain-containing protein [Acidiferrimicrobium sp. IK]|uniref:GGDEF domain-containing protein n=1 Tax=Acidiferrimicrobium sp. IK TaxID=2871700 RepID=UPI0021CB4EEE|nr:GGDEF domain-containing protein [Acidiferrimicrobium sp. IK]MCU4184893.1 GGDEF domain-containing protein [Acidiferrimicrobium sp. IK]
MKDLARNLRRPSGRADLPSLEERLGLLLLVRLGLVLAVLLATGLASKQTGLTFLQAAVPSGVFMAVTVAAELIGRVGRRAALAAHRTMLPLDAIYLVIMTVPAGGPRSQLMVLFYLHLVAVTLLGSARSALRIALWDSFLFTLVPILGLASRVGQLLGVADVQSPLAADTALAIMGFWAIAFCTAGFSMVSERELRRNRNELEALAVMTAALEAASDADTARRLLLAHTVGALGFKRGVLIVPGGSSLVAAQAAPGEPAAISEAPDVRFPPSADSTVQRAQGEHGVLALSHLDRQGDPFTSALLPDARNVVVTAVGAGPEAPVLIVEHGGRLVGERLARRTMLMVGQFASHGMLTLAGIQALADQERLAAVDGLTALANRRQFDATLTREVAVARRRNEPLTLVLIDIDHFKAVNDTAGHLAGDEVLRNLARALRGVCREMDLVARYGGEEFALVLPSCDAEAALSVLARADRAIRAEPALQGITISSGVATLVEHAEDDAGLIAAADRALYASKRAGRDRATVAAPVISTRGRSSR